MSKKEPKKQSKPAEESKSKYNFEEIIMTNATNFKLVADNSGYHFTQLNLSGKALEVLSQVFANYRYLEVIDLSQNNLTDFNALSNMPFMIRLNLEQNSIKDIKPLANEESFKSLKYLNLSQNKIQELGPVKIPLISLNLNDNKIEKIEQFDGNPKLKDLFLKRNKISAITFLNLPELKELKLAENKIKSIAGIEAISSIQTLKLKKNNIDQFDETFPNLEQLQYLDLRDNKIDKYDEILKLVPLPQLRTLLFKGNPLEAKNPNYLLDTVNAMLRLNKINSVFVTKSLKLKAFKFSEEKYNKEQEIKRQQEEDERLKELQQQQQEN